MTCFTKFYFCPTFLPFFKMKVGLSCQNVFSSEGQNFSSQWSTSKHQTLVVLYCIVRWMALEPDCHSLLTFCVTKCCTKPFGHSRERRIYATLFNLTWRPPRQVKISRSLIKRKFVGNSFDDWLVIVQIFQAKLVKEKCFIALDVRINCFCHLYDCQ